MGKTTDDIAMELDGEGAANFEQLQDLIRKECDQRDRKYARLEDKCNKLEQQITQKNPQKNVPQRGQSPNHEEPGASKKNKSNQMNQRSQHRTRPKSAPINNSCPKNRRNPERQGQATEKNNRSRLKNANKPASPSQNKSNRNPPNNAGRKKLPRKQQ